MADKLGEAGRRDGGEGDCVERKDGGAETDGVVSEDRVVLLSVTVDLATGRCMVASAVVVTVLALVPVDAKMKDVLGDECDSGLDAATLAGTPEEMGVGVVSAVVNIVVSEEGAGVGAAMLLRPLKMDERGSSERLWALAAPPFRASSCSFSGTTAMQCVWGGAVVNKRKSAPREANAWLIEVRRSLQLLEVSLFVVSALAVQAKR